MPQSIHKISLLLILINFRVTHSAEETARAIHEHVGRNTLKNYEKNNILLLDYFHL